MVNTNIRMGFRKVDRLVVLYLSHSLSKSYHWNRKHLDLNSNFYNCILFSNAVRNLIVITVTLMESHSCKVAASVCSLVSAGYSCVDWIEHLWSNNIPSVMHISCVFAAIFQICFGESFSHTFECHCTPWQIRFHFLRQLLLMFNSGPIHTL